MMTMFDDGYIAVPIHGLKDDGGDGGALELFRWWRARQWRCWVRGQLLEEEDNDDSNI